VAVVALGVGAGCAPAGPQAQPPLIAQSPDAEHLAALVNQFRAANGLGPLAEASDAVGKAELQAIAMANAESMFHSNLTSGIQPGWFALGENVGYGGSVDQINADLQASAPHRANLLSTSYDQYGVGVAVGGNGLVYVAEEFVGR
jgi:uncharacterized protein YkwD